MKLSNRLSAIAAIIPVNTDLVADIGSDHCQLPIFLLESSICKKAIAIENNHGPYEKAKKEAVIAGWDKNITVLFGNGLQPLNDRADVIVIAGMGGRTILEILQNGLEKISNDCLVILQPMQEAADLRQALPAELKIIGEDLVQENGHLFDIIICKKASNDLQEMHSVDPLVLEIGPFLLSSKHPLINVRIEQLKDKYEKIEMYLIKANKKYEAEKINKIIAKLEMIKYEYGCTEPDTDH